MFNEEDLVKYQKKELVEKYVSRINDKYKLIIEKFKQYQDESSKDLCTIDKTNVIPESNKNINAYHKYCTFLAEEKLVHNDYKSSYDKVVGELFDYYRNHSDISSKLKSESAIEKYVESHDCYIAINKIVLAQQNIINYLESLISIISSRNFTIKNIIEQTKIELGMM